MQCPLEFETGSHVGIGKGDVADAEFPRLLEQLVAPGAGTEPDELEVHIGKRSHVPHDIQRAFTDGTRGTQQYDSP